MLFRTGLSIPLVLAFVLGFTCFFFKVPTTEALKCFKCTSEKGVDGFTEKCKNPAPGDDFVVDCDKDAYAQIQLPVIGKDAVVLCKTEAEMKNGEMVIERVCDVGGQGEFRKCLDDAKYPPTSGCVVANSAQEYLEWEVAAAKCLEEIKKKEMQNESGEPKPVPEKARSGRARAGSGPDGKVAVCSCTEDLCNSKTKDELPEVSSSATVSSTRGSEGVIFSLTLLIHLYLQAAFATD